MICFCTDPVLCDGILGLLRQGQGEGQGGGQGGGQGEGQGEVPNSRKLCFFQRVFWIFCLASCFQRIHFRVGESVPSRQVSELATLETTNTNTKYKYTTNTKIHHK